MKLHVLDIPDDPAELAPWLDRLVVGRGLGDAVAVLRAVNARHAERDPGSLEAVLGGRLEAVLADGLTAAPGAAAPTLLRHPGLLLELQERVLLEGGDYWQTLIDADEQLARLSDKTWERVRSRIRRDLPAADPRPPVLPLTRPPGVGLIRAWAKLATVAASLLLFLNAVQWLGSPRVPPPDATAAGRAPWGWNRPDLIADTRTKSGTPAAHLGRLADAAEEWFRERPATPDALALRLGELRQGCTRLIVAPHDGLPPAERSWLVDRCRQWAVRLDEAVRSLETGGGVEAVRSQADETVRRLVDALRQRARSV